LPAIARAALNEEAPVLAPAPSGSGRFAWPISGAISARFGALPGGRRLDGIEITGTVGASVKAAADGEVVFAGDNLPGYDFLVLIAHADNYVTAYAYNRRALVREGQHVRAGETIAELGQRPGQSARLLFQVRQGGAPVDPAPLLGAR
jgi:lipoprotein NlpD